MRKISEERRKLAATSASVAAMSGVGPLLLRHTSKVWHWGWIVCVVVLEIILITKLVQLKRTEGCV
jgi:hypothetical protein